MSYRPYDSWPKPKKRRDLAVKIVWLLIAAFALGTAGTVAAIVAALS